MNKEVISNKQGISLIVLFVLGSAVVLNHGGEANRDVWLSMILAFVIALIINLLYARLLSILPGKDLFDILIFAFGKWFGKLISIVFIWYAFHLGSLIIRNFAEFIMIVSLPNTNQLLISLNMIIIGIWIVKSGLEVMGRWANFMLPLVIIVFVCLIILSLSEADFNNIKPILYDGFAPVIKSAFSVFAFPFAETVIFLMVFCSIKNKFNTFKVYSIGLVIGFFILFIAALRNVLVLGVETGSILYFPSYSAVSLIDLSNFLQRIEIIVAIIFLLAGIVKIGVCLYATANGISKLFNLQSYKLLVFPIALLMLNLSYIIYNNTMEMFDWALTVYPFYAIPFQIIIPIITLITAEIKVRISKSQNISTF